MEVEEMIDKFWADLFCVTGKAKYDIINYDIHIRNIGKIRNLLSNNACSTIIHALISCRLDYQKSG